MSSKKKIGIIGAGIGGLSAAVHLANKGFDVSVFEKNSNVGGKANNLSVKGFRFDTGPSLLTMPFLLEELFKDSNENISDYLTLKRLDVICKYFYPDKTIINAYSDINKFGGEIEAKTTDKKESIKNYFKYCSDIYKYTSELFLFSPELNFKSFLNVKGIDSIFNIKKVDPFRTMHQANASIFNDRKTIQMFDRYATYNGSNPYEAPATLNIIPNVEYTMGSYIVKEGIYAIPLSLKKLAEKAGVKFYIRSKVQKLLTEEKRINGIQIDGKEIYFDSVISNVDTTFTYKILLSENNNSENIDVSSSGIVFYWGVKCNFPALEIHNILFSKSYKKEFDDLFKQKVIPSDPTIYIYISSKFNKADAPEGCENWFVMINTPASSKKITADEISIIKKDIISKIFSATGIDLSDKIILEEILTPNDIEEKTGSLHGSIYGISSNSRNAAFKRNPVKSKKYNNLYFCGGSVHPGGGIPLVILSGKHSAELISRDLK